jgi:hypothetical protein
MSRLFTGWAFVPLAALALLLAGCISIDIDGESLTGENGSGDLVSESRAVTDFSSVEVAGALHAEYAAGDYALDVVFDDNLIDDLETVVRGGELRISCRNCNPSDNASILIFAPDLNRIEVSGASRVDADDIDAPSLHLVLSGASRIQIDGAVDDLEIDASGASRVEGEGLVAATLDVHLSGASRATIEVTDSAEGDLSGASRVDLAGDHNPDVDVDVSGGSSIR